MDWTHRLRLRNLKMLLSLAQTRNISHSAAMLNTTQPGLSKWLKVDLPHRCEAAYGIPVTHVVGEPEQAGSGRHARRN